MTGSEPPRLRVVEISGGVGGPVCGRLFAGLGHDVVRCEPAGGDPLRRRPPRNAAGTGLEFVALNADKDAVRIGSGDTGARDLHRLLDLADVAVLDLTPAAAAGLGLSADGLRERWPRLVAVWILGFGRDGDYRDIPGDSLLAEAYGGLATMIGEPDRRPLGLGGEQAAHCAGVTGFLGAMLALRRRDAGHGGDLVEVTMCDVVAYMDWKSDVAESMTGRPPMRSGADPGDWRLVRARDGWVGFIFQQKHWAQVVELVGAPELADPLLADESRRQARAAEWWPVVERWAVERSAEDIYRLAQRLGLPFGWAARASDLVRSPQLRHRGFITPEPDPGGSTPAVGTPVHTAGLPWRSGTAPEPADRVPERWTSRPPGTVPGPRLPSDTAPLSGIVVLDFGTITAGAAVTRLLADYGATVLKIEWTDRPDTFRSWKMPDPGGGAATAPTSPYFPSNNAGKLGVAVNLKTPEGREVVHRLARHSHILVENYRVGVTRRLGIDADTIRAVNPDLLYLSLSSQGQDGPEAGNSSYGSTLDLLSGLASVTGYEADRPLWSSSDVNYPDQLVSLFGAAFLAYCLQRGIKGVHLDVSQREVVSWTLAAEIADHLVNGNDAAPRGNRRPGRTPHDTYPCSEPGTWIAISCFTDRHRDALAALAAPAALAGHDEAWWWSHEDLVDTEVTGWTRRRTRKEAIAELLAAGVPAVPVLDAADRRDEPGFASRGVTLATGQGPVKGLPMRLHGHAPRPAVTAPGLGAHTRAVLRDLGRMSDEEIDDLEGRGVIHCGPDANPSPVRAPEPRSDQP
ncbi:CoA transferase [Actinomadura madurae]|uniref:CaiB/BaiF CoA-transferase family protein n=1 Tax=Actinomadura madurae TaxID=1993 RepID=UPI0020266341|nr:CoA transferase [Actinomadura madurae]URN02981.1 CoA transferase [Actinomadura madurae]